MHTKILKGKLCFVISAVNFLKIINETTWKCYPYAFFLKTIFLGSSFRLKSVLRKRKLNQRIKWCPELFGRTFLFQCFPSFNCLCFNNKEICNAEPLYIQMKWITKTSFSSRGNSFKITLEDRRNLLIAVSTHFFFFSYYGILLHSFEIATDSFRFFFLLCHS